MTAWQLATGNWQLATAKSNVNGERQKKTNSSGESRRNQDDVRHSLFAVGFRRRQLPVPSCQLPAVKLP
jgi:hypothetical protein